MALKRIEPGKRMSAAVIHGNKVYLAGFTPDTALGKSVAEQTKDVLTQIDATLKEAGTDKTQDRQGQYLADRHQDLRRNELGVGRLGGSRPDPGPRHGGSEARGTRHRRRDHGRSRDPQDGRSGQEGGCRPDRLKKAAKKAAARSREEGQEEVISLARLLPAVPDIGPLQIKRAEGGQRKSCTGGA